MTEAYPLAWPAQRPRTQSYYRKAGVFRRDGRDLTIRDAMFRLEGELDRLGGSDMVLSSNLILNRDGSPRSGQSQPVDPGVALYFQLGRKPICMPCDTYTRVEQNIAAIAKHIEATRAIERYGVASLSEMFAGFVALPSPNAKRPWREVMAPAETLRTKEEIEARYRTLARIRHPDVGGSEKMMAELNQARADALSEIA
jgi:hypothetical protein